MIKHFTAQQIIARRMKLWDESHSIEKDREFREAIAKYMTESAIDPETKKPVPAHPELLKEIEEHPEYLVEMFFIIVDKKQQTVPFFFNSEQRKLINHIAQAIEDYKAGKRLHLKFLVLKGRQFGATTAITAYQLARAITQKNFSGITLADVIDNTNTIFEKKAKFPYNNLPELIQPVTKYNNRREFLFSKINSSWYISTAGNKDVGRSNTINFFHGCIHKDSLVIMADNTSKRMEEVVIGDIIITSSGDYAPIINKWHTGQKQTYTVSTWLGNQPVKMTESHKILTIEGYKECKDLTTEDWICVPTKKFTNNKKIYKFQKARTRSHIYPERNIPIDYDFGYMLGYYLAEGHVKEDITRLEFASHKDEKYIEQTHKIAGLFAECKHFYYAGTNRARHVYDSRELAQMINEICGRTEGKHLPEWIYDTNIDFAKGIIAGYFAGDGSKTLEDWSRSRAISVIEALSRGMRLLISSVYKVYPSLHFAPKRMRYDVQNKPAYTISVHGDVSETIHEAIGVIEKRNRRRWINKFKLHEDRLYVRIKSIEKADIEDVYDIEVGHEDHNFLTTIGIVSNSEAAFWGSISDIVTGLGEALTKDSIQVLESTANGFNEFKDLWDGAPDNTWEALFFYWWDTVEYRMEYESPKKQKQFESDVLNEGGDSEELQKLFRKLKHLKDTYSLEWNQLYWYYNKWKGYIDKEKIKQEYPCNPREAFLASGRCVFNTEVVQNRIDELEILYKNKDKAPRRGFFSFKWHDEQHKDYILDETITWVNDPQGYVWIYEDPQPMIPYAIGGDTKGEGKDFYAASCKDNTTGKRKAYIEAQFYHSKPFTWQVYCMGRYYHNALIGIEMNWNTAPIEELERLSYPSQYIRQKYDSIQKQIEPRYGWKTDGVTRPYMIDAFIELVNEHPELFPHIPMLNQCLTFIYDEENRPDAEVGKHDDILLSDMILEQISTQQTHNPIKQEVKLEGFYTESELEDMGYSPREIQRILSTQKSY